MPKGPTEARRVRPLQGAHHLGVWYRRYWSIALDPKRHYNPNSGLRSTPDCAAAPHRTTLLSFGAADSTTIRTDDPVASPAQALDLFARAVVRLGEGASRPEFVPLRLVLGPTEPPPELATRITTAPDEGLALCHALVEHVDATGHLPTAVRAGEPTIGPGPLLRAVASALFHLDRGSPLPGLAVQPGAVEPAIAARLAQERVYEMLPNWTPHDPDLRLDQIALHTRLQSWSLKPAIL